jgi:hypothetical protein
MTQVGIPTINSYVDRVRAVLSALPQEIRFVLRHDSTPLILTHWLKSPNF